MNEDDHPLGAQTRAVRAGTMRSQFNEHSEALFLTSSFVFDNAQQAARRFAGQEDGYVYSRFSNPTVRMFEQRLAALEGGQDCLATASGMSAILTLCLAHLKAGDHVLCGANVFGATVQLFSNLLARFGIETTYVQGSDPSAWRSAARARTRLMFCETPSNPLMDVADLEAFASIGRELGALTVVDNCFCTPALQRPLQYGVDVVMHTATKYLDGQGRVLGGALVGRGDLIREALLPTLRTTGPSLSPFNAWVLLKGLETLSVRVQRQTDTAATISVALAEHPKITRLIYPGRTDHPQAAVALKQMRAGSTLVAFEVKGGKAAAFRFQDTLKLVRISNNLGDAKSLITHPATTTHQRLTPAQRDELGISDGFLRISAGLEHPDDLVEDIMAGLAAV